ncbi:hypothetical protein BLOT_005126 [Blomia tropicalis]|nr:hypothetical protein BLOT_005126 [Blomia tropicalis]
MKNSVLSPQKKRGRGRGRYNAESRDISSEYSRFGRTRGRTRHTTATSVFRLRARFASRTHASTPTQQQFHELYEKR